MSNYYLLRHSLNTSKNNCFKGDYQATIEPNKFKNIENYNFLIDILGSPKYWEYKHKVEKLKFSIERIELSPQAELTDILNFSPALMNCPFFVSKRVKNIFEKFQISNLVFYKTYIFNKGSDTEYYLMHMDRGDDNFIDYKKSTFIVGTRMVNEQVISFNSVEDKNEFKIDNLDLDYHSIYIKKDSNICRDIFRLNSGQIVVSEGLKQQLNKMKVTGVVLLPAFEQSNRWPSVIE